MGLRHRGSSSEHLSRAIVLFKLMWRVAEPNEALIISGLKDHAPADAVQREPRLQDRHRPGHARHPRRADGPAAVARPAGGGTGHRLRHPPGNSPGREGRRDLQGGRRLHVDRQLGPPFPRPAGPDGPPGAQRLRRPPAGDRREHDGRGDDPRPGEAHPADPASPRAWRWRSWASSSTPCRCRRSSTPPATSRTSARRTRRLSPARPGSPRPRPTGRPPSGSRRPTP